MVTPSLGGFRDVQPRCDRRSQGCKILQGGCIPGRPGMVWGEGAVGGGGARTVEMRVSVGVER